MINVLILCTGNSCRSQMAHGYLNEFLKGKANIYSAGVQTHGINQDAVAIMKEDGIDISSHTSNHVDEYKGIDFQYIITVCDNAKETCPYWPSNAKLIHYDFPDPSKSALIGLARTAEFARVRDLIKNFCNEFAAKLKEV